MKKLTKLAAALTLAGAAALPFQSADAFWGDSYWDHGYGWGGPYGHRWGGPYGYGYGGYGYGYPGWGYGYPGYGYPAWGYGYPAWGYGHYPPVVAVPAAPPAKTKKSD